MVSDHACCSKEFKANPNKSGNIFLTKSGFGGTEYLLSGLVPEGIIRGMSYKQITELACWSPTKRYGLRTKCDIAVGYDADVVLLDPHERFTVRATESESTQSYTPFESMELTGKVKASFLRGNMIYEND